MKCHRPEFIHLPHPLPEESGEERPELPDTLTDCLSGKVIPFSNRDNIRQKILRFLLEERGYRKEDILVDRQIHYEIDGCKMVSFVDIAIALEGKTMMIWKCASGSLVSRHRQIMASARLLEKYLVPFAAVTNGKGIELLDSVSGDVKGEGFDAVPAREELARTAGAVALRPANSKKAVYEQRVLYTYDAISCPSSRPNTR